MKYFILLLALIVWFQQVIYCAPVEENAGPINDFDTRMLCYIPISIAIPTPERDVPWPAPWPAPSPWPAVPIPPLLPPTIPPIPRSHLYHEVDVAIKTPLSLQEYK